LKITIGFKTREGFKHILDFKISIVFNNQIDLPESVAIVELLFHFSDYSLTYRLKGHPAPYINDALTPYSFDVFGYDILTHIKNLHYGYQWWCGTSGSHTYNFAWGHGGNLIVILHDLNMVVVATADSLPGQFGEAAAIKEKRILNLVGEFIGRL
jgi:hypothetical protein